MGAVEPRSPADYFEAGMELLAGGGVAAVTVARLCDALGVTKGSFYHHFRGVEDFKAQLLAHWASEREQQAVAAAAAVDDPFQRLDLLREAAIGLHHEAEVAIRAWSRHDAAAWKVRETVDAARERVVAEAYRQVGVQGATADLLGRMAVAVLVGVQHRSEVIDRCELRALYRRLQEMAEASFIPSTVRQ